MSNKQRVSIYIIILNWLYAQLHYFLIGRTWLIQVCLIIVALTRSGIPGLINLSNNGRQETRSWLKFRK